MSRMNIATTLAKTIDDIDFVCVDVEATGLHPMRDEVTQIAAKRFTIKSGEVVEIGKSSSFISGCVPIPAEVTEVTGIRDSDREGAPSKAEFMEKNMALFDGAWPVAYNAKFDSLFVPAWYDPSTIWVDPMVMISTIDRYVKGSGRFKLGTSAVRHKLFSAQDVEEGAHRADFDVEMCSKLFAKLATERAMTTGDFTLHGLLRWQETNRVSSFFDFMKFLQSAPPQEG